MSILLPDSTDDIDLGYSLGEAWRWKLSLSPFEAYYDELVRVRDK